MSPGLVLPCQPVSYGGGASEFPRGWPVESDAAVRLCTRYCPLLEACRAQALRQPPRKQPPGVLGGLTLAERLAGRRSAIQRGTDKRRRILGISQQYERD